LKRRWSAVQKDLIESTKLSVEKASQLTHLPQTNKLIAADDFLRSFQISVETYKGIVQLSGFVSSQMAVNKAGEIARGAQGVKSVKNDLIVK
jgi:osmotically-inducible protein OsmY